MNQAQKQAFSLLELMVVIAVIGILVGVGAPAASSFLAKMKQSEAKTELSRIYTAESAYYTEYRTYTDSLFYISYFPDGATSLFGCWMTNNSTYGIGFASLFYFGPPPPGIPADPCGFRAIYFSRSPYLWPQNIPSPGAPGYPTGSTPRATANNFQACARGTISGSGTVDYWAIDENRNLTNIVRGY